MAKRFTDTEMWDKEWYMHLSCKLKCLSKLIRDKADLCGIWSPNWAIASMLVGEQVTEADLLNIDNGSQFKKLPNGKIYCIGFIEFQYGELSEKSPVHKKIIGLLVQNGLIDNYKKIGCLYPINRVQEEEEEKEKEEETDEKGVQGEKQKPLKTFNTMPTPEDVGELPEMKINSAIQLIKITKQVDVTTEKIIGLWSVFKNQSLTGKKFYADVGDTHSHFLNWLKTQTFTNGTHKNLSTSGPKLGTSAAKMEALKNW